MHVTLPPLFQFVMGYAAILAVPGPNVLTLGALTALRGTRSSVPVCLGMAAGASFLAGSIAMANGMAPHSSLTQLLQVTGAAAVVFVAYRLVIQGPGISPTSSSVPVPLAEFSMGFCTAATNPITAGYFAVQFAGPMASGARSPLQAAATVSLVSFGVMLGLAALLARRSVREHAIAWHRPIRVGLAMFLVLIAGMLVRGAMS
jgi:threonine/homoserine/homoserine lactone efflux protein